MRVLDVACGTGDLALAMARAGSVVTGIDLAENRIRLARAHAAAACLPVRFETGDAEWLPYPSGSFDVVTSAFGAMFAPHPHRAAEELIRVCRPGGRIMMANWTPEGFFGRLLALVARYQPGRPQLPAPARWGNKGVVCELFDVGIADLRLAKRMFPLSYPHPPEEMVALLRETYGPVCHAFDTLEPAGQDALRRDLVRLWSAWNQAGGDATFVEAEYLEVMAVCE
jgi:SAM-dependent methyltransferase